jgi:diguanylate cyclase (GGDEF)-like protein
LPDVAAVALLTCAFASVARNNHTPVSRLWLIAWVMIALHFTVSMFMAVPGIWGAVAAFVAVASLTWSGVLFMWASVPYRNQHSSPLMLALLVLVNTLYLGLLVVSPTADWALTPAALLFCVFPLGLTLASIRSFSHPLRWSMVLLYSCLAAFLLAVQHRPEDGIYLALDAVLFTVYFGCCIHFFYMYRRATAAAFITIAGFFAWASVFVVGPVMDHFWPHIQIESEVWNLPKYVVAVGMMLLLLEDQIAHNKHLALHDVLTGLPNRRLFQDRLASSLERSRRTGNEMALLVVDLDGFKKVNDTLGHHIGDLVLQHVASTFVERVRRSDTVSRTGGDEFSVILEEPANRADAEHVGKSLRQLLDHPLNLGDRQVQVGASIGIAVYPEDASDAESLCIAADLRMYDAKHSAPGSTENDAAAKQNFLSARQSKRDEELRLTH